MFQSSFEILSVQKLCQTFNVYESGVHQLNNCVSFLKGSFRYHFTIPGVYYYSSGYLDDDNMKVMQGVVKVQPLTDKSSRIVVHVRGIEAKHATGGESK